MRPITFVEPNVQFLHRGFVVIGGNHIFWTIHNLHHYAHDQGLTLKLNQFVASVRQLLAAYEFVNAADVREKPKEDAIGLVPFNLASTVALLTFVSASLSLNQTRQPVKDLYGSWLRAACKLALDAMVAEGAPVVDVDLGAGSHLGISPRTTIVSGTQHILTMRWPLVHL